MQCLDELLRRGTWFSDWRGFYHRLCFQKKKKKATEHMKHTSTVHCTPEHRGPPLQRPSLYLEHLQNPAHKSRLFFQDPSLSVHTHPPATQTGLGTPWGHCSTLYRPLSFHFLTQFMSQIRILWHGPDSSWTVRFLNAGVTSPSSQDLQPTGGHILGCPGDSQDLASEAEVPGTEGGLPATGRLAGVTGFSAFLVHPLYPRPQEGPCALY